MTTTTDYRTITRHACQIHGQVLTGLASHKGQPIDGPLLLWTIAGCESDFGRLALYVRHEPAYMPGGKYYAKSYDLRQMYARYGVLAASSYGAWQVMFPTARELGFSGHPIDLQLSESAAWAAALIRTRIIGQQNAATLEQILDAYNTGTAKDRNVPLSYITKGVAFYQHGWIA